MMCNCCGGTIGVDIGGYVELKNDPLHCDGKYCEKCFLSFKHDLTTADVKETGMPDIHGDETKKIMSENENESGFLKIAEFSYDREAHTISINGQPLFLSTHILSWLKLIIAETEFHNTASSNRQCFEETKKS